MVALRKESYPSDIMSAITGWAELQVSVKRHEAKMTCWDGRHTWLETHRVLEPANTLTIFDSDWKNTVTLPRRAFYVKSHGKGRYGTGGHNWHMTTRFDVWFTHPHDGFEWHGVLITGGYNATFRTRRTKTCHLLTANKHHFREPIIERIEDNFVRVADGPKTLWYARWFPDGWQYGPSIGEIWSARLLRA